MVNALVINGVGTAELSPCVVLFDECFWVIQELLPQGVEVDMVGTVCFQGDIGVDQMLTMQES